MDFDTTSGYAKIPEGMCPLLAMKSKIEPGELVNRIRRSILVKDRKHLFRTYRHCFVAHDLVKWLVREGHTYNKEHSVKVGCALHKLAFITHYVDMEKQFKDGKKHFWRIVEKGCRAPGCDLACHPTKFEGYCCIVCEKCSKENKEFVEYRGKKYRHCPRQCTRTPHFVAKIT